MPTSFLLCCGLAGLFVVLIFTILWLASIVALMHSDQIRFLDKLEKLTQEREDKLQEQTHDGFFQEAKQEDGFKEHNDSEDDSDEDWDDDEDWEEYNAEEDNEEDWEECDEDDDDEDWDEYDEDEANWDDDEEWDELDEYEDYDEEIEDKDK